MDAPKKSKMHAGRGRRQADARPDHVTNPAARGDSVVGAIYGALRPLDEIAAKMESRWGAGRLEVLVSPETASKFGAVRERLNAAIDAGAPDLVAKEAAIMWRGWQALDQEATRLGAEPRPPGVWEITGDDGKLYRITLTDEDKLGLAAHVEGDEAARVLSVEELLRVFALEHMAIVKKALDTFPGAQIVRAGPKDGGPGPLFEVGEAKAIDDEIPF
jgi:hypothetical protein